MKLKKMLLVASAVLLGFASCKDSDEDPYMTLETKALAVEAEGGTYTVDLSSNVFYRVNNDCQNSTDESFWAVIDSYESQGEVTTYTFKIDENTSTTSRTGTVRFIGDKVTPLKLTITQKGMVPKGIDPLSGTVSATTTEASFSVFGDKEWTASCDDADVTVSPTSGLGDAIIKLNFPVNTAVAERTIKVNVTITDDATYTYTLTQEGYSGVIADWNLNALSSSTSATFSDDADQTVFPGTNGKYVLPSEGNGKIEYWACDRTPYISATPAKSNAACKRAVGGNGDPYISGSMPGDYWYIYGDMNGITIPAGTKIHVSFVTKLGTMCSNYWMLEYKDGDDWKPVLETKTVNESATTTLSGASISYSATVTYNWAGMLLDTSNNGAYIVVDGEFTLGKDTQEVAVRFGQVGHVALIGAKYAGNYIDWTHTSCQSRMSAQQPNNTETGAANKVYDQHVLLEIVK